MDLNYSIMYCITVLLWVMQLCVVFYLIVAIAADGKNYINNRVVSIRSINLHKIENLWSTAV